MRFRYTIHSLERMRKRKVTNFEVEQTVLNPDNWHYDKDDPKKLHAIKHWPHRTLEVVYLSTIEELKIITMFII